MPRASADRPARRLDAILAALRRHGIRRFKAGKLDGIGEGLEWSFEPAQPQRPGRSTPARAVATPVDPDLADERDEHEPIDELALVAQGREGPVSENGVS